MSYFHDLLEQLRSYAPQTCIECDGASYTYAQMLEELDRWQLRFDELNVTSGSVIGIRTDYSFAAVAALLALLSRRAIVALIPRVIDVSRYLGDAHAAALLDLNSDDAYQWHLVAHPTSHPLLDRLRSTGEGGLIIFTSGSTGYPKAALQGLGCFLHKFRRPGRRFRTLAFLLLDHVAGLDTLFYALVSGATLIFTRRRDPASVLSLIESYRVEVLPVSPTFLRLLCATKDKREHDLLSLKIITYGSEPMDSNTLTRLNARFPNVQITQKYGTTETGSPRTVSRGNDSLWLKLKSDGTEMKVIDNVLWLRGEGTMVGYLNAPSPIDEQGWYCTGDLVDVDGEWVRFRGRASESINVGGEKVGPTEIEQAILELDFVCEVMASGEPHPLMGQIVVAKIVLTESSIDPKEAVRRIRLHCRERLAPYKRPVSVQVVTEGFASERHKAQRRRPESPV